jgi:hypothetical protein
MVGEPEGKMPLWSLRFTWEDNIKIVVREIGRESNGCIKIAQ